MRKFDPIYPPPKKNYPPPPRTYPPPPYGFDASVFPRHLMKQCERIVKEGRFQVQRPTSILSGGYDAMYDLKQPIVGSSTVCIVVLERLANTLYSANLGYSGCLVVRSCSIVHRTAMQQHFFNTPFQLAMLPPPVPGEAEGGILSDRVVDCSEERFQLQVGDIVMVATDGLFDNLADSHILKELNYLDKKVMLLIFYLKKLLLHNFAVET